MATFQLVRSMQARHLKQYEAEHHLACGGPITVRINGIWREVFDVWADGDDPATTFGDDGEYTKQIGESIDYASPCWVVVRYVVEERSNCAEVSDAIHRFRTCDLVDVQVPEPLPLASDGQLDRTTARLNGRPEAAGTPPIRYSGIVEDGRSPSEVKPSVNVFGSTEDEVYQGILSTIAGLLASGDDYDTDPGWLEENPVAAVPVHEPGAAQEWLEAFRENSLYPYWTVLEAESLLDMRASVIPDR